MVPFPDCLLDSAWQFEDKQCALYCFGKYWAVLPAVVLLLWMQEASVMLLKLSRLSCNFLTVSPFRRT